MSLNSAKTLVPIFRLITLCVLISVTLSGLPSCGVTDFVTAYFNTYYNAQRVFSDAETEVMSQLDTRPTGRNWLLTFGIQATTRTKLESVIEKCSKLLQYHPESGLVDDALLMIGKSYYYEDDNQQAVRKFNEIISGYPDGSCAVEARLLLSYAQYRMNLRDDARTTARAVVDLAKKNDQPDMVARASLVLGQMAQEDRDYNAARELYQQAAESGGTAEQRSSAWLQAAEMYRRMEKYPEAQEAFRKAVSASNNYAGEYRGRMGELRMETKQGRADEALKGYRLLRSDAKNKEFFGEIELEIANTYREMGDLPGAVEQYVRVDTAFPRSETSAKSYFALGDIYEHMLFRYDSALAVYSRGRNEFPTVEASRLCARRADYLMKYFQYRGEIAKFDTLRDALLSARDTMQARPAGVPGADTARPATPPRPAISVDSANTRIEMAMNEVAGLFFATIGLPDSAETWYRTILAEFPGGPFAPRAMYTLAQIYSGRDSVAMKPVTDSLYFRIVHDFPRSDFAPEARRLLGLPPLSVARDSAEIAYDRAEKLLLGGDSTAAAEDFKTIARAHPTSPAASRALYAAGWIYENRLLNADSAIASYTLLAKLYPGSLYAARVAPKLAEVRDKLRRDADTTASRRVVPAPPAVVPAPGGKPGEVLRPPAGVAPQDSLEIKRPPGLRPKQVPEKEGPTP